MKRKKWRTEGKKMEKKGKREDDAEEKTIEAYI